MSVQSFDHDSRRVHLPARLADRSHLLPAISSEQAGGGAAATFAESPDAERPAAAVRTSASPDSLHALRDRVGDVPIARDQVWERGLPGCGAERLCVGK